MGVTKNGGESTLGSSRELILNTTYLNYKGINSHLDGVLMEMQGLVSDSNLEVGFLHFRPCIGF
ncbi:hypothetical protein RchiOBHm_Chr3g0486301 [Rosa chinensis]|uniref:Uncharacterized protein n=1 Tax=Rosa chinensis TaxID=74649 RepID=A0A2P6RF86_ROSCH|nr:hypothetical protein RchiOBHm_Chr3g0486301 [Rosa chinensis]